MGSYTFYKTKTRRGIGPSVMDFSLIPRLITCSVEADRSLMRLTAQ